MNLQIVVLLALFTPLAAADGAACGPSSGGSAGASTLHTATNDVNGNGIEDAYEIATGSLTDDDLDGIPDEAEALAWDLDEAGTPRI